LVVGAAAVLLAVTVWVLRPGGGSKPSAAGTASPTPTASSTVARTTASSHVSPSPSAVPSSGSSTGTASSGSSTGTATSTSSAAPAPCNGSALRISAVAGAATYNVGAQPLLMLQVANPGPKPCVQDLADAQVELVVYNGESRVWGSHDCEVQPGQDLRTLAVGQAVRVSVTWSGLSSQPKCAGSRQRVGAGTYTLYARLSGHVGTAAQFSIT
jgi:hypothetical protein